MPTDHSTVCGWKGTANYFTVTVHGEQAENAAWTYRMPKEAAANIKDFIAFYPVVTVETWITAAAPAGTRPIDAAAALPFAMAADCGLVADRWRCYTPSAEKS